ncbi:MAG TPA: hypothetical protein PLP31_02535 [Thermoanaerobaculaceae bacterium]|nr:hypothetical protein [Thermoanaerobaculaceae bacterium]
MEMPALATGCSRYEVANAPWKLIRIKDLLAKLKSALRELDRAEHPKLGPIGDALAVVVGGLIVASSIVVLEAATAKAVRRVVDEAGVLLDLHDH